MVGGNFFLNLHVMYGGRSLVSKQRKAVTVLEERIIKQSLNNSIKMKTLKHPPRNQVVVTTIQPAYRNR
jgi:hypothetical protein